MIGARAIAARVTARWVARSPRRTARLLQRFAETELGSAYTMRWAAGHTEDPARRAAYLRHALDEERHARMFHGRARRLSAVDARPLTSDAEDVFASLGERRFLAFVAHAERRGRLQFEAHVRALAGRDDVTVALLSAVIEEEREHERYARALLEATYPGTRLRSHAAVLLWEAARGARRGMDRLTSAVFRVVMTAVYWTLLPLALLTRAGLVRPRSVLTGTRDALRR